MNIRLKRFAQSRALDAAAAPAQAGPMTRLTIRIDFSEDAAFGPGKALLLELLDGTGSIRGAAARMDMSYRRAWLLLRDIETVMGAKVAEAATGGAKGGGTRLNRLGRQVLAHYRAVEARAAKAAAKELRALARMRVPGRGRRSN
ncbi:MAG TPA: LysR family transcriptional regulator [Rhizomicrobium sp.]|nr:LysR family transcriptional regulator [Rhizomicrobium sp.]